MVEAAFAVITQDPTPSKVTVPEEMLQTALLPDSIVNVTALPEVLDPLTVKVPLVTVRLAGCAKVMDCGACAMAIVKLLVAMVAPLPSVTVTTIGKFPTAVMLVALMTPALSEAPPGSEPVVTA